MLQRVLDFSHVDLILQHSGAEKLRKECVRLNYELTMEGHEKQITISKYSLTIKGKTCIARKIIA